MTDLAPTHRFRRLAITCVVGVCAALGACAAPGQGWQSLPGGGGNAGVFKTSEVQAYDRSPMASLEFDRFEYARLDPSMNPVAPSPIVSQMQWPRAPMPLERPVQFQRWEQR